jgi:hypothetical protein
VGNAEQNGLVGEVVVTSRLGNGSMQEQQHASGDGQQRRQLVPPDPGRMRDCSQSDVREQSLMRTGQLRSIPASSLMRHKNSLGECNDDLLSHAGTQ